MRRPFWNVLAALVLFSATEGASLDLESVQHGEADSGGVKIHYAHMGKGPVLVMVHGFPDYWYSWRDQMPALAKKFHVVAIDQRGYNRSDQPEGVQNYIVPKLVGDVAAVLKDVGAEKATILGHDWGGMVAWSFAMANPEKAERLIILTLPHPRAHERAFVLAPLAEIAPKLVLPGQQKNVAELLPTLGQAEETKTDQRLL